MGHRQVHKTYNSGKADRNSSQQGCDNKKPFLGLFCIHTKSHGAFIPECKDVQLPAVPYSKHYSDQENNQYYQHMLIFPPGKRTHLPQNKSLHVAVTEGTEHGQHGIYKQ